MGHPVVPPCEHAIGELALDLAHALGGYWFMLRKQKEYISVFSVLFHVHLIPFIFRLPCKMECVWELFIVAFHPTFPLLCGISESWLSGDVAFYARRASPVSKTWPSLRKVISFSAMVLLVRPYKETENHGARYAEL